VDDALAEAMQAHPEKQMRVLCTHTHGAGEAQVLPNLQVLTRGRIYGRSEPQRVINVE
jgi:hypothetical protein